MILKQGDLNESRRSGWRTEMGKDNIWINSNKKYFMFVRYSKLRITQVIFISNTTDNLFEVNLFDGER